MLGYESDDDLIGLNMHSLIHHTRLNGKEYPLNDCPIFNVINTGEGIHIDDEVLWRADGSSFPSEYWSYPIIRENGITGAVVTFLDITERRQAEEGLLRSQKMEALGKLTGGIAHDYNNMLGVILGYTELLELELKDQPGLKQYIDEINTAGLRGAKLTNRLLGFSRKKSNEEDLLIINTLLQDDKNLLEKTLTIRIKLSYMLEEDLYPIWLDRNELEDAILNMSINAMHAIEGNGQLTIKTSNENINKINP